MKPFFSVVIPTYNRAHCIANTIQSVIEQTYENWELVLVDDGSTDNTAELVKSWTDSRIRYFYKTNGERGAARNFGAQQATGEYLFFLDSDDLIKPGYLACASELIAATNTKCLHIPYNYRIGEQEKKGPSVSGNPARYERIQNRFACQVIIHRSCMNAFQFSENRNFKIGEDWYFILLLLSAYKFEIATERLGLIVQHTNRSMVEAPFETVLQSLAIFEAELLQHLPDPDLVLRNVRHELTNLAALHAAIQKKKKTACKLLLKSIQFKPFRLMRYRNFVILKKVLVGS
ncbi:MAG: glycosyltransferase family 2 protein [Bacteroidetes bacterium]|nr:glycosyltransferase family 2 protein [Bacteroidota bacterium]